MRTLLVIFYLILLVEIRIYSQPLTSKITFDKTIKDSLFEHSVLSLKQEMKIDTFYVKTKEAYSNFFSLTKSLRHDFSEKLFDEVGIYKETSFRFANNFVSIYEMSFPNTAINFKNLGDVGAGHLITPAPIGYRYFKAKNKLIFFTWFRNNKETYSEIEKLFLTFQKNYIP